MSETVEDKPRGASSKCEARKFLSRRVTKRDSTSLVSLRFLPCRVLAASWVSLSSTQLLVPCHQDVEAKTSKGIGRGRAMKKEWMFLWNSCIIIMSAESMAAARVQHRRGAQYFTPSILDDS